MVVSETFLTTKSLAAKNLGGVAGGTKFVFRGILFKLSRDAVVGASSKGEPLFLYGGREQSYEAANKGAGHELRGAMSW